MIHELYSIRDTKTEVFGKPFTQFARGEATRTLMELVNDPQSMISKYPEDYDLYYLGRYDDALGTFKLEPTPSHVAKAIMYRKTKDQIIGDMRSAMESQKSQEITQ